MLWPVVDHVAALAEGQEVGVRLIGGVVVAMSSGQDHPGRSRSSEHVIRSEREAGHPARTIAPRAGPRVLPAAVAGIRDGLPVRTPAALTAATSATEADHRRQLRPIDGVEEAMHPPDRHGA